MSNEDNKMIKYNQGENSIISPFIIYADLDCLLEKISTCYNNPEESSTTEINKHTPSGYSLFTHCSFDKTKKKLDYYRDEDCMKKFCLDLREHAIKMKRCVDSKSCIDYMKTKDEKLIFRGFSCKKNYEKDFNEELIKRFANSYKFCDNDLNKFILLLRKGVYPYEYMDNWERFDETSLLDKEPFIVA